MAWAGKILGGVLGSFAGPWGIAIGVGLGHQFDKGASRLQSTNMAMQVAFFGCLAKMAKADGRVSAEEIAAIEQIFVQFGYSAEMRNAAVKLFRQAKDDEHSAVDYLNELAEVIHYNPQLGMTFLIALHSVAQADGQIHPNEREILMQAERIFRLPTGTVNQLLGIGRTDEIAEAYQVLECTPEMSDAEIKKKYRQKCMDFHPDKLAAKGLPSEFMKYANEQLAKINEAYDALKKARNI